MDDDPRDETGYLNMPESRPMTDRGPRPQTNYIGPAWKLQIQLGSRSIVLETPDELLVGRSTEETAGSVAVDLAEFGGYQSGVSRKHAMITRLKGALYVEDLDSTNGTRINGFGLTPHRRYRLRDGDEVEFGRLSAVIRFIPPSGSSE